MVEEEAIEPRYHISMDWYQSAGRSFGVMAESRMCSQCRSRLGSEVESRVPVLDAKGTRVVFETRLVKYGASPIAVIRDCCSKSKGYITANLPLMEIAFRVLLANGNQPMTAEELSQQIEEHVTYAGGSRSVNADALTRVLENDDYYGICEARVP
ncbi:MAG: hypothetical protein EPO21_15990 [Chloroflexota bacterium]|nr:MAG: hypothetical protein EPO21_15990 [Chloroflexota bacterium]